MHAREHPHRLCKYILTTATKRLLCTKKVQVDQMQLSGLSCVLGGAVDGEEPLGTCQSCRTPAQNLAMKCRPGRVFA
eukprot:2965554-Amphidinium_carterae.1